MQCLMIGQQYKQRNFTQKKTTTTTTPKEP